MDLIIDARGIDFIRDSKYILEDVNWSVKSGEHWAILGLNGSGKTSLLNMVNGYIFPSNGTMQVLGKRFGQFDLRELRKSIGWVSPALQEKFYMHETAEEIIISGKYASIGLLQAPEKEDLERARFLLDSLGCTELSNRNYQTLSQGEKQKILIARGLMSSPKLLILDEPCTGLDIFAREHLLEMIDKLAGEEDGPSLVYVTHHVEEILPVFQNVLLLQRGRVHSSGSSDELLTDENLSDFFERSISVKRLNNRNWIDIINR